MKDKRLRIAVLVLLLLVSFSFLFSQKRPEPQVAFEEPSVVVKKKKTKRSPSSIAPAVVDNRPVLGTGFGGYISKQGPPSRTVSGNYENTSVTEEVIPEISEREDIQDSGVNYVEDVPDQTYTSVSAPFAYEDAPVIPLAPKDNGTNNSIGFSSVGLPTGLTSPTAASPPPSESTNNTTAPSGPGSSVSYIGLIDGQLIIRGTNLDQVRSLNINGALVNVDLTTLSQSGTEIVAMAMSGVTLLAGTIYNLVIEDAIGQAMFPIDIELADGSVSLTKLASLPSGQDGYIIVWDEGLGRWVAEPQTSVWLPATGGIHYSSGDVGIGTNAPTAGLHLVKNDGGAWGRHYFAKFHKGTGATANDAGVDIGYIADGTNLIGTFIHATNSQKLHLGTTNHNQLVTITDSGSFGVGIGPNALLPDGLIDAVNDYGDATIRARGTNISAFTARHITSGIQSQLRQTATLGSIGTTSDAGSTDFAIFTNGQNRIFVERLGDVGVGTSSPGALFQVGDNGDGTVAIANAWTTFSDVRLKKDFAPIDNALEKVQSISGYTYNWKDSKDKSRKIGVKAQEVQKVFPEVVSKGKDGILSVSYDHLIAPVIEAIKELSDRDDKRIKALEEENARLRKQNEELDRRLSRLERSK